MTHEEILNKVIQDMKDYFGYEEQTQADGSTKLVFTGKLPTSESD